MLKGEQMQLKGLEGLVFQIEVEVADPVMLPASLPAAMRPGSQVTTELAAGSRGELR